MIQLDLGIECQQIVCMLHLNELFLRHRQVEFPSQVLEKFNFIQEELDGPTSGPNAWSGPIGKRIVEDVWLVPKVGETIYI